MAVEQPRQNMEDFDANYATSLPSPEAVRERFTQALRFWERRNRLIKAVREMIAGQNKIPMPKQTMYKPRIVRSYLLAAAINEKRARFLNMPEVAVIPDGIGIDHQTKASDKERALNEAMAIIDRNGDSSAWDRALTDAIALDEGVELIERAPAAFWPELMIDPKTGKTKLELIFEDPEAFKKAREEYKKQYGLPMRSIYVPLEHFFPIYEASTIVECFHIEYRSLRSVLGNAAFSSEARAELARYLGSSKDGGLSTDVCILRYCNQWWYAYYALTPASTNNRYDVYSNASLNTLHDPLLENMVGQPILLMAYEHGLGRVMYNTIPGRFGGWKTGRNGIEPVMNALIEMNQAADILLSQVATNIGARYWPNLKVTLNPEWRGATTATPPRAPTISDGEPIALYIGEQIEPIFRPEADPMAQWMFSELYRQFQNIAGSAVVMGGREPGVDSGYQHNLQITQSEHLDEKIEMNLSVAVRNRCEIIAAHIKALGEPVWVGITEKDKKSKGKVVRYIQLKPDDFTPMPRIDARVRKPKPIDFLTSLRAARDASADRRGRGTPLLSDDTIYELILNISEPDEEMRKIWLQNEIQKLFDSGFITQKITEKLNMRFFEDAPKLDENAGQADSALIAAMQQGAPVANQLGGVSEEVANLVGINGTNDIVDRMQPPAPPPPVGSINQQPLDEGPRRVGGLPYGAPQPEQVIANAIRQGMRGGRRV